MASSGVPWDEVPEPCTSYYSTFRKLKLEHAKKVHEFKVFCVLNEDHGGKHQDLSGKWEEALP